MKPDEVEYDFSKLDESEEFQSFLNWSLKNKMEEIDFEACKKGIDEFCDRFIGKSR